MTLTESLRKIFKKSLTSISSFFLKIGFSPNSITILGLLGSIIASIFIAIDQLFVGGIIAAFICPFDAIDGTMARLSGKQNKLGCLLDSIVDRYSEMILLLGVQINFADKNSTIGIILTFLAMSGSFLVSYVRARSEGLDIEIRKGILTRVERLVVLILSLLINQPLVGVLIIAVLANITAIQRFWIARSYLRNQ